MVFTSRLQRVISDGVPTSSAICMTLAHRTSCMGTPKASSLPVAPPALLDGDVGEQPVHPALEVEPEPRYVVVVDRRHRAVVLVGGVEAEAARAGDEEVVLAARVVLRVVSVRTMIAGTLGRMQPRCQQ